MALTPINSEDRLVQATFAALTPFVSVLIGSPMNVSGSSEVVVQG